MPFLGGHAAEATRFGLVCGFFGAFAMVCLSCGGARPAGAGRAGGGGSVATRVGCGDDGHATFLVAALEGGFPLALLVGEQPIEELIGRFRRGELEELRHALELIRDEAGFGRAEAALVRGQGDGYDYEVIDCS